MLRLEMRRRDKSNMEVFQRSAGESKRMITQEYVQFQGRKHYKEHCPASWEHRRGRFEVIREVREGCVGINKATLLGGWGEWMDQTEIYRPSYGWGEEYEKANKKRSVRQVSTDEGEYGEWESWGGRQDTGCMKLKDFGQYSKVLIPQSLEDLSLYPKDAYTKNPSRIFRLNVWIRTLKL